MAIWQYPLHAVPKKDVVNEQGQLPSHLKIEEEGEWINVADTSNFWKTSTINSKKITALIDDILPRDNWSHSEVYTGWKDDTKNNKDNDCFISINDDVVTSFSFRVDLRDEKNITSFLVPMLSICNRYSLVLIGEGQVVMEPEIEAVRDNLFKSRAANYIRDPNQYIERVSQENKVKQNRPVKTSVKQSILTRIWKKWNT